MWGTRVVVLALSLLILVAVAARTSVATTQTGQEAEQTTAGAASNGQVASAPGDTAKPAAGTNTSESQTDSASSNVGANQQSSSPGAESSNNKDKRKVSVSKGTRPKSASHAKGSRAQGESSPAVGGDGISTSTMRSTTTTLQQSLATVVQIAQDAGLAAPAAWSTASSSDAFANKQRELQQKEQGAQDEPALTQVAYETALAVQQTVQEIQAAKLRRATMSQGPPGGVERGRGESGGSGKASLYIALLALLMSGTAVIGVRYLARWETNKALINAGLI